jgi:hypothetical protein
MVHLVAFHFERTYANLHLGEYQDRRKHVPVDCSKTLWILATNALDPTIKTFCKAHKKIVLDDPYSPEAPRILKSLQTDLKNEFKDWFGVSLYLGRRPTDR